MTLFEINKENLIMYFIRIVIILTILPLHEFAHAYAAHKLGDPTAKNMGRLTLNPFKHIDIIGSAMLLFVGIGFAKPVPVNSFHFKNRKRGMALTAAAGPLSNLIVAYIFMIVLKIIINFSYNLNADLSYFLFIICYFFVTINITLAVFNLLPVPPFDGSRIFALFLPEKTYFSIMKYEQFIMFGFFILIFFNFLDVPLFYLNRIAVNLMNLLTIFLGSLPGGMLDFTLING